MSTLTATSGNANAMVGQLAGMLWQAWYAGGCNLDYVLAQSHPVHHFAVACHEHDVPLRYEIRGH